MGTILQFRCSNENCPGNYCLTALHPAIEQVLVKAGAMTQTTSAMKCKQCGSVGLVDLKPMTGTVAEKTQHEEMLADTLTKLRQTGKFLQDILGQKKMIGG